MPVTQPYPSAQAEAARYALLRRLSSSLRHHLVLHLQPIGMIYEVMDRRLRAPVPDLAHVRDSAGKINTFARATLGACADVVGWIAPDDTAAMAVDEGARECAALLATSFGFRGYALRNEVRDVPGAVRRSALRHVLVAALLHCTDRQRAPAELSVTAAAGAEGASVRIAVKAGAGDVANAGEATYRRIAWDDVQALAAADGVQLGREGDAVVMLFPWAAQPAQASASPA